MLNLIKKYYKDLLLVAAYTAVAIVIYVVLFQSLWQLWYVSFLTAVVILALGAVIGFFYIKSVIRETEAKEAKEQAEEETIEAPLTPITEVAAENKEEDKKEA